MNFWKNLINEIYTKTISEMVKDGLYFIKNWQNQPKRVKAMTLIILLGSFSFGLMSVQAINYVYNVQGQEAEASEDPFGRGWDINYCKLRVVLSINADRPDATYNYKPSGAIQDKIEYEISRFRGDNSLGQNANFFTTPDCGNNIACRKWSAEDNGRWATRVIAPPGTEIKAGLHLYNYNPGGIGAVNSEEARIYVTTPGGNWKNVADIATLNLPSSYKIGTTTYTKTGEFIHVTDMSGISPIASGEFKQKQVASFRLIQPIQVIESSNDANKWTIKVKNIANFSRAKVEFNVFDSAKIKLNADGTNQSAFDFVPGEIKTLSFTSSTGQGFYAMNVYDPSYKVETLGDNQVLYRSPDRREVYVRRTASGYAGSGTQPSHPGAAFEIGITPYRLHLTPQDITTNLKVIKTHAEVGRYKNGTKVTYKFVVENTGDTTVGSFELKEEFPVEVVNPRNWQVVVGETTATKSDPVLDTNYNASTNVLSWTGEIRKGQKVAFTVDTTLTGLFNETNSENIINKVCVENPQDPGGNDLEDEIAEDDCDDDEITTTPDTDLRVIKTHDKLDRYKDGSTITYNFQVDNLGESTVYSFELDENFPKEITNPRNWRVDESKTTASKSNPISDSDFNVASGTLSWSGAFKPGETIIFKVDTTLAGTLNEDQRIINNVCVENPKDDDGSELEDIEPNNDCDDDSLTTNPLTDLSIIKAHIGEDLYQPGSTNITYTFRITNKGETVVNKFDLIDGFPSTLQNPRNWQIDNSKTTAGNKGSLSEYSISTKTITWDGEIKPNQEVFITAVVDIAESAPEGSTIKNTACVKKPANEEGDLTDINTANDCDPDDLKLFVPNTPTIPRTGGLGFILAGVTIIASIAGYNYYKNKKKTALETTEKKINLK